MAISGGQHRGTLFSSDERARTMEDLQFSLGEGPCLDCYHERHPVLVPEVAGQRQWPAFAESASAAGLAAIFAFPLVAYDAPVGAFNFYRDQPGGLDDGQVQVGMTLADVATRLVLDAMAKQPPEWLPPSLETFMRERREVHEATGMLAVQLQVGVDEALAYLRAYAWSHGRPLGEVSVDVVERRLRFDSTRFAPRAEPDHPG